MVWGVAVVAPADYHVHQQEWVITAFRNALWQLLHAQNLEETAVDTPLYAVETRTSTLSSARAFWLGVGTGRDSCAGGANAH